MGKTLRYSSATTWFALAAGLLIAAGPAGAQGVTVALTPTTSQVEPGSVFALDMTITEAGSPFNAFYAIVGWDPAALTPVSQQEGTLMTSACGNRFYKFSQGADTDTIGDGLLCSGVSVTGPGQIFHFEFRASDTPQVTYVRFLPGLQFYKGGLFVNPAISTDATIGIGVPVDVGSRGVSGKLGLRVAPNPAQGRAVFTIECDRPGLQRLHIIDLRGRVVRRLDDSVSTAGRRTVAWDGRDMAGKQVPAGVYLVTLEVAGRSVSTRVSLLR
jgi:hypothetical protein